MACSLRLGSRRLRHWTIKSCIGFRSANCRYALRSFYNWQRAYDQVFTEQATTTSWNCVICRLRHGRSGPTCAHSTHEGPEEASTEGWVLHAKRQRFLWPISAECHSFVEDRVAEAGGSVEKIRPDTADVPRRHRALGKAGPLRALQWAAAPSLGRSFHRRARLGPPIPSVFHRGQPDASALTVPALKRHRGCDLESISGMGRKPFSKHRPR